MSKMMMVASSSVLVAALLLAFLPMTVSANSYIDVSVYDAKLMIDSNPALVILDVRTQDEYNNGHIRNAKLIPNTELAARLGELNPADTILVYCLAGGRSAGASATLADNGFLHVYNMLGGINAWISAGYPVYVKPASIQKAINDADPGDTLYISSGTYYEHVLVNKSVSLVGENKDTTVVDGGPAGGIIFDVTANNVAISEFTIQNSGCWICGYRGIRVGDYSYVNITDNKFTTCGGSISLVKAKNVIVARNSITNDLSYCMEVYNATNIIIHENTMNGSAGGIDMKDSNSITITANRISNAPYGFYMVKANNNIVYGNTLTAITFYGIYLQGSNNTLFTHNNFLQNKRHVAIQSSVNMWDDGFEGNYWSNYTGVDAASKDGVGDTPHVIDDRNSDTRPLMGVFHRFEILPASFVAVTCNSTLIEFTHSLPDGIIRMHVTNSTESQTHGFARVMIPHELMNISNLEIVIDGGAIQPIDLNYEVYDNGTHRWIYFAYEHSTREIVILPESPAALILPLLMMLSLITAAIASKRKQTQRKTRTPTTA